MNAREILDAIEAALDDCAATGDSAAADRLGSALELLARASHARASGIARRLYGDISAAETWERASEGFISRARSAL